MAGEDINPDPLAALAEFFGEQFDDGDSESVKREVLNKATAFLNEARTISSSSFPYKDLTALIEQLVPVSTPPIATEIAQLYLLLLEKVSVAYNELTFSSCLHHASRILKECPAKTRGGKSSKTMISTAAGQFPIKDYVQLWSKLTGLFSGKVLDANDPNVSSFALQSFCELIRYGHQAQVLDAAVSGICKVLSNSSNFAIISSLYKVCIPIARVPLLSANRKALVTVILEAAASEEKLDLARERRNKFVSSHSEDVDEMEESKEADEDAVEESPQSQCSTEGRFPVLRFLELCCLNVAERSDDRTSTAKFVHQVISEQSDTHIAGFQRFLEKSSRCPRTTVRMLTIELAAIMIQGANENGCKLESIAGLLEILQARSQDRMPTVRYKAMHLLTESLQSIPDELRNAMKDRLFKGIGSMIGRLRDEKARVRKSATEYLGYACRAQIAQHMVFPTNATDPQADDEMRVDSEENSAALDLFRMLELLRQRTSDASAMVRQKAAEELSESLLASPKCIGDRDVKRLFNLWANGVLPLVEDSDQRCRDASVEKANMVVFSSIEDNSCKTRRREAESDPTIGNVSLPSLFLAYIGDENQSVAHLGRQLTMTLCKSGKLGLIVIEFLCSEVKKSDGSDQDKRIRCGAWIVLEAIARSGKARDVKRKLGEKILEKELGSSNASAFGISLQLTRSMDTGSKSAMVKSVLQTLFPPQKTSISSLSSQSIFAAVEFLASLQHDAGDELLEQCEAVVQESGEDTLENVTAHVLQVVGSVCTTFKLWREPPDALLHFVEASASQVQKSSKIRALALSTLGKMCLCESSQEKTRHRTGTGFPPRKNRRIVAVDRIGESLTRKFVAMFVHELENATSSATRNNAVVVLCDLCRRYTAVVEPFVSRLAALLTDSSEFVRVQVISSLVSLLQEDYIKIRTGAMLYQIANCLLDSSETVRATAEYALLHVMVQKNASILASSFVELVFVLNACTASGIYNQFPSEMQAASLKTFEKCDYDRRLEIYQVFLRGMTPEQRIRLPGRLRSEVLASVVDEKLSVTDLSVSKVLEDTLNLLIVDQLCNFARVRGSGDDENGPESIPNGEESQSQSSTGGNVLIQKVQSLELRESTIPVLLELRKLLERLRSPILKSLMRTLCTLLRPHRNNLETMIGDAVVRAEVAHEIAKPQKERQQQLRNRARQKKRGITESIGDTQRTDQLRTPAKTTAVPSTPRASSRKPPLERPSVPRSKRISKRKRVREEDDEDDEDEDDIQMASSCRRLSMMDRICESPKLVAMVRRGAVAASVGLAASGEYDGTSTFAATMARIEGEAKS